MNEQNDPGQLDRCRVDLYALCCSRLLLFLVHLVPSKNNNWVPSILNYGGPFRCIPGPQKWVLVSWDGCAACSRPPRLALLTGDPIGGGESNSPPLAP